MKKQGTKRFSVYELSVLALLAVVMYISQTALAWAANIELVSLLCIVYTRQWRAKALIPIYIFAVMEIFTYGPGLWNICYLYVWTILWAVTMLLGKHDSVILWTLISAIFGLMFGMLCSILYFFIGGPGMAVSWWASGIMFDIVHCVGNGASALILYWPLTKLIARLASHRPKKSDDVKNING